MKILIAEDNITTRALLKKIVEKMGFDCDQSEDGLDAWNKMGKLKYRMLITDWMMPSLDGIDLCRKIRQAGFKNYIYIILLTGKTDDGDIVDGLDSGADDYIKKPFNKDELQARIKAGMRILDLYDRTKKAQAQMLEAGKRVALGNLAEGISHEINTPAQYIINNTVFLEDSFREITAVLDQYRTLFEAVKEGTINATVVESMEGILKKIDLEYLKDEIPEAFKQNLEGLSVITKIVSSMKSFAKPGVKKLAVDINKEIENIITISTNEWKKISDISVSFDESLPLVDCFPGELNQVFLNLIINANYSIEEKYKGTGKKGNIKISTEKEGGLCKISVTDTGCGIPEEIQSQVFDPFFTTKEVGIGTGQGLAVAYSVITEMHNGSITLQTRKGLGTRFVVRIPIKQEV